MIWLARPGHVPTRELRQGKQHPKEINVQFPAEGWWMLATQNQPIFKTLLRAGTSS